MTSTIRLQDVINEKNLNIPPFTAKLVISEQPKVYTSAKGGRYARLKMEIISPEEFTPKGTDYNIGVGGTLAEWMAAIQGNTKFLWDNLFRALGKPVMTSEQYDEFVRCAQENTLPEWLDLVGDVAAPNELGAVIQVEKKRESYNGEEAVHPVTGEPLYRVQVSVNKLFPR